VQTSSKPVRIGLLSDIGGPYRDVGGPGSKVAVELAVEDFGGSVLGRPIEVLQSDDQKKPDIAGAIAREWADSGVKAAIRRAASGLAARYRCNTLRRSSASWPSTKACRSCLPIGPGGSLT
jgi:branched-chain amino acid transport system substrate-binding protein